MIICFVMREKIGDRLTDDELAAMVFLLNGGALLRVARGRDSR